MNAENSLVFCYNHEKNVKNINRQIISPTIKLKAVKPICEKPSKVIYAALNKNTGQLNTILMKDIHSIRNNFYNN